MEDVQNLLNRVKEYLESEEQRIFLNDKPNYILYKGVIDADKEAVHFLEEGLLNDPSEEKLILVHNQLLTMLDPISVQFEKAKQIVEERSEKEDYQTILNSMNRDLENVNIDSLNEDPIYFEETNAELDSLINELKSDLSQSEESDTDDISNYTDAELNEFVNELKTELVQPEANDEEDIGNYTDEEIEELLNSLNDELVDFDEKKIKTEDSIFPTGIIDTDKINDILSSGNEVINQNSFGTVLPVEETIAPSIEPAKEEVDFSMFDDLFE